MVFDCCVPLCNKRIGGHKFPADSATREKWIVAIKRLSPHARNKLWEPGPSARVCSVHFTPDDYHYSPCLGTKRYLRPTAVPSVFPFRAPAKKRHQNKKSTCHPTPATSVTVSLTSFPGDIQSEVEVPFCSTDEHELEVACNEDINGDADSIVVIENGGLSPQEPVINLDGLFLDCKMIKYYTGFDSYDHFTLLFNVLGPAAFSLDYKSKLGPKIELLVVLMKLRQAKDDEELAMFFGVTRRTIGEIVRTWINFLYYQLKEINIWAAGKVVRQHTPEDFGAKFPSTRVILDATEIPVEKPSNVLMQSASFSHYKNRNTVKTMIGISPRGSVTYISDSYGGSTSDRQIIERSDLLSDPCKFDKGDTIMADRGINVQDLFAARDVQVNIPNFLKGKTQLETGEVMQDRRIASKRIHVERIIGLAKRFKILKRELDHNKLPVVGRIVFICFSLVNFLRAIVSERA